MARPLWAFVPVLPGPWLGAFLLALLSCSPVPDSRFREVPGPRVVSLVPSLGELTVAMGGGEHLVARTDYDTHPVLQDLPSVGGGLDPSLERLVELEVEVVLVMEGQGTPALTSRLEGMGVRVLTFSTSTLSDLDDAIHGLGELLGKEAQADSLARNLSRGLQEVREQVRGREGIPVMYLVSIDPPMTAGPGTFIHELIEIAGGRNVFDDLGMAWPTVTFEAVVERNPEVLIWPKVGFRRRDADGLQDMPGWREVPAVQGGRIVPVDPDLFSRPGPALPEAARRLAQALHPEAFSPSPDTLSW